MPATNDRPLSYGVLEQRTTTSDLDKAAEDIIYLGYAVIDSGYSAEAVNALCDIFDAVHKKYVELYREDFLREIDEYHGIRLPLAFHDGFKDLAMNSRVLELAAKLIKNQFILNQQNGIINPPGEHYNQGTWHRDLPYQHFVSSKPLAVNALYCVDDFTGDNGATFVLPASHAKEPFPSESFIAREAKQITARAGSFIVLDGMLFHRGGQNKTNVPRRAVNQLYTTAFIKQQIDIRAALENQPAPAPALAELLGFKYQVPRSVADFLRSRRR